MTETTKKKGSKKTFFEVRVPLTAAKVSLYGSTAEELVDKTIKLDLTRVLKGKNFELRLKTKLVDEKLEGEPVSLELMGSYIRRMMRTGADYVEDSFIVDCKDRKAIIKPFLITRNKVSRSVRKELRNTARKHLESYVKNHSSSEIFSELTTNKIQKELFLKLKKVYPLALCEIRIFEVI